MDMGILPFCGAEDAKEGQDDISRNAGASLSLCHLLHLSTGIHILDGGYPFIRNKTTADTFHPDDIGSAAITAGPLRAARISMKHALPFDSNPVELAMLLLLTTVAWQFLALFVELPTSCRTRHRQNRPLQRLHEYWRNKPS